MALCIAYLTLACFPLVLGAATAQILGLNAQHDSCLLVH